MWSRVESLAENIRSQLTNRLYDFSLYTFSSLNIHRYVLHDFPNQPRIYADIYIGSTSIDASASSLFPRTLLLPSSLYHCVCFLSLLLLSTPQFFLFIFTCPFLSGFFLMGHKISHSPRYFVYYYEESEDVVSLIINRTGPLVCYVLICRVVTAPSDIET